MAEVGEVSEVEAAWTAFCYETRESFDIDEQRAFFAGWNAAKAAAAEEEL